MDRETVEAKYHGMGLETRYVVDEPGEVYEPHEHASVYIFTLEGSAKLRLGDEDWKLVKPGQEVRIEDNQRHEAIAGKEGWKYIFAASEEEIKRLGL